MTEVAKTPDSGLFAYASANLPRYTSYPTAPHCMPLNGAQLRGWFAAIRPDDALSLYVHMQFARAAEIDQELRQAQAVYDWWKVRDRLLPLTMFYQKGLSFSRKAATARRLLAILAEHGLAERHEAPGLEMWRRLP
jgi:hypothetical protein